MRRNRPPGKSHLDLEAPRAPWSNRAPELPAGAPEQGAGLCTSAHRWLAHKPSGKGPGTRCRFSGLSLGISVLRGCCQKLPWKPSCCAALSTLTSRSRGWEGLLRKSAHKSGAKLKAGRVHPAAGLAPGAERPRDPHLPLHLLLDWLQDQFGKESLGSPCSSGRSR